MAVTRAETASALDSGEIMEDQTAFYRFLFRTAFCFMACDGQIHDREINEIKRLADTTTYFKGVKVEEELRLLVKSVKEEGRSIFKHYLDDIGKHEYDVVQELMLLEVALRVIYVDVRIDANEVKFVRLLRSKLQVPDEIILQRFGTVDLLLGDKKVSKSSGTLGYKEDDHIAATLSDETFRSLDVNWEQLSQSK